MRADPRATAGLPGGILRAADPLRRASCGRESRFAFHAAGHGCVRIVAATSRSAAGDGGRGRARGCVRGAGHREGYGGARCGGMHVGYGSGELVSGGAGGGIIAGTAAAAFRGPTAAAAGSGRSADLRPAARVRKPRACVPANDASLRRPGCPCVRPSGRPGGGAASPRGGCSSQARRRRVQRRSRASELPLRRAVEAGLLGLECGYGSTGSKAIRARPCGLALYPVRG